MNISTYTSDYWKSSEEFLPSKKHLQTKAETYTVEGYNSRMAMFKRKGKCYSKAEIISLNLLFMKLNNEVYILI